MRTTPKMEDIKNQYPFIFPTLISLLILLWFVVKFLSKRHTQSKNPPPSPPKLPVIGNLHQLSHLPHHDLRSLAKKHGPLMLIHFGSLPVLIVSSADAAREIMKTHDTTFADRPTGKIQNKCLYNCKDIAFSPYGDYWRQAKSIFVLQLLSNKRVQSFRYIEEEQTALLLEKIGESRGAVDLSRMFYEFGSDGICRTAFGKKYNELENGKKFMYLVKELSEIIGAIDIGKYIPWLSWISRFNGMDEKMNRISKGLDDFLDGVIEERLKLVKDQALENKNNENLVDIMIQVYNDESNPIDKETIKAIILDAYLAGTDTTAIVMEWAMSELLGHPSTMETLHCEIRQIVGHKHDITQDDLDRMPYLKAVIKETLRCHTPFPLLLPRTARADVKVSGYDISAGTMVMVNAWAISRDPASWDEPEEFKPERFLNSSRDFKGLDYEFVPFGAGRRGCPGIAFSIAKIEFLLANLLHKFNWKLPDGEHLDMKEGPGITAHRALPLLAVATKAL